MSRFLAAALQLNSTSEVDTNLRDAEVLVRRAAGLGAQFVATPENTNFLGPHQQKVQRAEGLDGPTVGRFSALARELSIHLLLGSFNERAEDESRCYNCSVLFSSTGEALATYRKIHLFDVDLSDAVRFVESDTVVPGTTPVTVATDLANFGLSICYDLRFGELYRRLTAEGAEVLTVPSAFTATTGKDHWQPLLVARAIENQSYVVAPAQWGRHDDDGLRESHGHAMIVDPWGQVVSQASDGVGMALAEIDLDRVDRVRRALPVQAHRRLSG